MILSFKRPHKNLIKPLWVSALVPIFIFNTSQGNAQNRLAYDNLPFNLNTAADRVIPIDLDGDGLKDIISADKRIISIYFQKQNSPAFTFTKADMQFELPKGAVGWDLDWENISDDSAELSTTKAVRIVAIVDGKKILAWSFSGREISDAMTLVDGISGDIPLGAYPLHFVKDINDDQLNDFIVPGAEHHDIYLQQGDGSFGDNIQIKSNLWVESVLVAENDLTVDVGQQVRIPEFSIRDVNGDGSKDLVSRANNILEVFLAKSDGSYPNKPSYGFDLNDVEDRLGEIDYDNIDFSNLSALARYSYDIKLEDVNNDNIEDLLLREGNKVVLYGGTKTGMDLEKPKQVLRSSGNLVSITLLDENEDGLKDLWLLRLEDISLGKAFVWLALSGSINIETFIYLNQGDRFASRPHKKKTITLTFPSILKTIGMASDINEMSESDHVNRTLPATLNNLNQDAFEKDLIILSSEGVSIHVDVLKDAIQDQGRFLGIIDNIRDKDEFVIDLGEILSGASIEGQNNLSLVKGKEPILHLPIANGMTIDAGSDLFAVDMNNDQKDDIFVLSTRDQNKITGTLFLSK